MVFALNPEEEYSSVRDEIPVRHVTIFVERWKL